MPKQGTSKCSDKVTTIRRWLRATNVNSWLLGCLLFSIGSWVRWEQEFEQWLQQLEIEQYWYGCYVLMAVGLLVMMTSFLGCSTAAYGRQHLLSLLQCCCGVVAVGSIAGASLQLHCGLSDDKHTVMLADAFTALIARNDDIASFVLRTLQRTVGCCGGVGADDYITAGRDIPVECRDQGTGNMWADGCAEVFAEFLETRTGWLAAIAYLLSILQMFIVYKAQKLKKLVAVSG